MYDRDFFWSAFFSMRPVYTEIYSIQSKYGKIRTRIASAFEHFSRSALLDTKLIELCKYLIGTKLFLFFVDTSVSTVCTQSFISMYLGEKTSTSKSYFN